MEEHLGILKNSNCHTVWTLHSIKKKKKKILSLSASSSSSSDQNPCFCRKKNSILWYRSETFFMAVTYVLDRNLNSSHTKKTISRFSIFHLLFHFYFTRILSDFGVIVSICPWPSLHQRTQACRRETHARNNDLSTDPTVLSHAEWRGIQGYGQKIE